MKKLVDLIRVGRWLLCRFFGSACRKKETAAVTVPAREHVMDRGDARLVLLSTESVILRPRYSELVAPVRYLPHPTTTELEDAIHQLHLVKIGSPSVFPVDLYLSQLEETHALSECVQTGTSSISLALELSGQSGHKEVTNDFLLHFCRHGAQFIAE